MADETTVSVHTSQFTGEDIDTYLDYSKNIYNILFNKERQAGQILALNENKEPTWISIENAEEVEI